MSDTQLLFCLLLVFLLFMVLVRAAAQSISDKVIDKVEEILAEEDKTGPQPPTTYRFTEINDSNPEGYQFVDDYKRVIIRDNQTGLEILMLEGDNGVAAVILPQFQLPKP